MCLDIDDTLSTEGKLTAQAFQKLWDLKNAGFAVVPVTGRPAGWCDHFARFWPVDAIVGENGAFTFYMEGGVRKRIDTPFEFTHELAQQKLHAIRKEILVQFPEARFASDQSYREFDLAVDICEDVPAWKPARVDELLKFCRDRGAHAKLSSIHVNLWFGDYDKCRGLKHWLAQGAPGWGAKDSAKNKTALATNHSHSSIPAWSEWLYIGDSPNDEPLFQAFPVSVGVANIRKYWDKLQHKPTYVTASESGAGFSEMAERLIASR